MMKEEDESDALSVYVSVYLKTIYVFFFSETCVNFCNVKFFEINFSLNISIIQLVGPCIFEVEFGRS